MKIHFYLTGCFERFSPLTAAFTGIGGSEQMAIDLSTLLAAKGHEVRVWAQCFEGLYHGVYWHDWTRDVDLPCDLFVSSRVIERRNPHAKVNVFWAHDTHYGPHAAPHLQLFDRVIVLSEWHKEFFAVRYPTIKHTQVIRNGIPLTNPLYTSVDAFKGNRGDTAFYASSPDRGLAEAILMRDGRHLDVYYGFENLQRRAANHGNTELAERTARLHNLVMTSPGVRYHGRVSRDELFASMLQTEEWCYPTNWDETSCLVAMQAQLAGCYPNTNRRAALAETVLQPAGTFSRATMVRDARMAFDLASRLERWEALV